MAIIIHYVLIKPMYVSFYWSANTGVSVCRSPLENVTYEFGPSQLILFVLFG